MLRSRGHGSSHASHQDDRKRSSISSASTWSERATRPASKRSASASGCRRSRRFTSTCRTSSTKNLLRKAWNRSRSIEVVREERAGERRRDPAARPRRRGLGRSRRSRFPTRSRFRRTWSARRECFALRVAGDSMIDDHIVDGDVVVLESRKTPRAGETVVALIRGEECTLKRFYQDGGKIRLVPANERAVADGVPGRRRRSAGRRRRTDAALLSPSERPRLRRSC